MTLGVPRGNQPFEPAFRKDLIMNYYQLISLVQRGWIARVVLVPGTFATCQNWPFRSRGLAIGAELGVFAEAIFTLI